MRDKRDKRENRDKRDKREGREDFPNKGSERERASDRASWCAAAVLVQNVFVRCAVAATPAFVTCIAGRAHLSIWVWVKIKPPGIGPQVLVLGSIYQGNPFWVPMFDPQPFEPLAQNLGRSTIVRDNPLASPCHK